MNTYEFYVRIPVYVPVRCDAPDISTAKLFEKSYKEIWPHFLKKMCPVKVPRLKKVEREEEKKYVVAPVSLKQLEYDWLTVAENLGIVRDPGEELQYRE